MRAAFFLLLVLVSACGRDISAPESSDPTLDPSVFARVLGELAVARVEALPDTVLYRQRRAEILRRAGVTEEELHRFVDRRGGNADLMSDIYSRVAARIDSHAQR